MLAADPQRLRTNALNLRVVERRLVQRNSPAERRELAFEGRRERIRRLVDAAPPVTAEQATELRRLLDASNRIAAQSQQTAA